MESFENLYDEYNKDALFKYELSILLKNIDIDIISIDDFHLKNDIANLINKNTFYDYYIDININKNIAVVTIYLEKNKGVNLICLEHIIIFNN